ncbi:uncharacterized protein LOC110812259, partial [Carica papaya]|uniref:uncharacterized protein LOC110812259 n=1 Tax=Carica papaya TaxID=3649 RepID=UPI000B8CC2C6
MGGGAMRTAAKVANIGVGGIRGAGFPSIPAVTEQSMMRSASKQVSPAIVSASHSKVDGVAQVQRPSWEVDDWEFIGSGEERVVSDPRGGEPMGRTVVQGPPSLQEAKDATTELKDALDKVYLSSPKSTGFEDSFASEAGHVPSLSLLSNAYCLESRPSETKAVPVPKHAMQAFALLSESPEAQNVVASIASDPKVWDAVLKNDALLQFLDSQK